MSASFEIIRVNFIEIIIIIFNLIQYFNNAIIIEYIAQQARAEKWDRFRPFSKEWESS